MLSDLEPRNILVRKGSPRKHELAGIIDWGMVGFSLFAYGCCHKDTVLGNSNLSLYYAQKPVVPSVAPRGVSIKTYQGAPDYRPLNEEI
jgi:hypothetical protein